MFNKVGYEAVSFFVVLSGFIITWVALRQGVGRVFVSRRPVVGPFVLPCRSVRHSH